MASSRQCLEIALQSSPSQITASDGRQVPFTRAVLMVRNLCDQAISIEPNATLAQEGGTIQDVTSALSTSLPASIPPGGAVTWDVFDRLHPAHQGAASKVHMFGYRAVLNWRFDIAAWAAYHTTGSSELFKTATSKWSLRWSIVNPTSGSVGLTIEEVRE